MRNKPFSSALYELLSSMRFAVSLLTLIAIASIIGTVLKQNEAYTSYQVEFGPFWFQVFEQLGFYDVYHSSWFLLIFAFLVCSTSLCIYRHLPGIVREMRSFRLKATKRSLLLMSHQATFPVTSNFVEALETYLKKNSYRFRTQQKNNVTLWAAKKGVFQKLGYLFAHIGIVVICIGGLLDGNVILKLQETLGLKTPELRQVSIDAIPEKSRLSTTNHAFRANIFIPEGKTADFAWVNSGRGVFLQELPFELSLKAFEVAYYSTGQPKKFISHIIVKDKQTGKITEGMVAVNHPLIIDNLAIYQASFGDGGSNLDIQRWDLNPSSPNPSFHPLRATSLSNMPVTLNGEPYQIEWGEFRVFNIENMGKPSSTMAVAPSIFHEKLDVIRNVKSHHELRHLGPSIQFKLRDKKGQAHEYVNYMQPFLDDGQYYLMSGVRETVGETLRFIRLPLDKTNSLTTFMQLRHILLDKKYVDTLIKRMIKKAQISEEIPSHTVQKSAQFRLLTERILARFQKGGFLALEEFMQIAQIPEAKRPAVAQTYTKILQAAAIEALLLKKEILHQPPQPLTETDYRFVLDSLIAISQLFDYKAPAYFQLSGFQEVKASGFQINRSPGKEIVYVGCLLLVLGILAMFYLKEIRIWVRLEGEEALFAMSSNRKNLLLDNLFTQYLRDLREIATSQKPSKGDTE